MSKAKDSGGFTKVPNVLLDKVMPIANEAELRVTLAVARCTVGWQEERARISFTDFQKLTGLSRKSVSSGIEGALARGTIVRRQVGQQFEYELVTLVHQFSQVTSNLSTPKPVTLVHQEKPRNSVTDESNPAPKEKIKENPRSQEDNLELQEPDWLPTEGDSVSSSGPAAGDSQLKPGEDNGIMPKAKYERMLDEYGVRDETTIVLSHSGDYSSLAASITSGDFDGRAGYYLDGTYRVNLGPALRRELAAAESGNSEARRKLEAYCEVS